MLRRKEILTSKKLLFLVAVLILSLCYFNNILHIADTHSFENWQSDSERLVLGRIYKSETTGILSDYGLLQQPILIEGWNDVDTETDWAIYDAQIGLQGMFFSALNKILSFTNSSNVGFFYFLNCFLVSILLSIFILWCAYEYSISTGYFVLAACALNYWLTISAKNLYWMIALLLLPFISILTVLWLEDMNHGTSKKTGNLPIDKLSPKARNLILFFIALITIFIKSACGFELITSIMCSMEIPLIYYSIKNRYTINKFVKRGMLIGTGGLTGFFLSLVVNFYQRSGIYGGRRLALESLLQNINVRTGLIDSRNAEEIYRKSLEEPLTHILHDYISQGDPLILTFRMEQIFLIFMCSIALLLISREYSPSLAKKRNMLYPMVLTGLISIICPVSWFILAKGHSYYHKHINYILWSIPTLLLLTAVIGEVCIQFVKDVWNKYKAYWKRSVLVCCVFLAIAWPAYQHYEMWDVELNVRESKNVQVEGTMLYQDNSVSIYIYRHALFYFVNLRDDSESTFKLHYRPVDTTALPEERQSSGFANHDFKIYSKVYRMPFWNKVKIAKIALPDYIIESISIGEYDENGMIWEKDIDFQSIMPIPQTLLPLVSSDDQFTRGISINGDAIKVKNNQRFNWQQLEGKELFVDNMSTTVSKVTLVDGFVYIELSMPVDSSWRYPTFISVRE